MNLDMTNLKRIIMSPRRGAVTVLHRELMDVQTVFAGTQTRHLAEDLQGAFPVQLVKGQFKGDVVHGVGPFQDSGETYCLLIKHLIRIMGAFWNMLKLS